MAAAGVTAIAKAELIDDPRFSSVAARVKNSSDWYRLREESIAKGTTAHWLALFAELDIPAMPCHALAAIPDDPHLTAVKLVGRAVHPTEGPAAWVEGTFVVPGLAVPIDPSDDPSDGLASVVEAQEAAHPVHEETPGVRGAADRGHRRAPR